MRKRFILLFTFFGLICAAQIKTPVSPEVSSLLKVVSSEVNESQGVVNVNIPLHNIDVDDIKLPIYLFYDSKGIKIEEEASNVGTSWSINMGGVISRNQAGVADEFTSTFKIYPTYDNYGYFLCNQFLYHNGVSFFDSSNLANETGKYYIEHNGTMNGYTGSVYGSPYLKNPEPDLFSYSLPNGRKGTFIINGPYSIESSSNDKIFVSFDTNGNISGFNIIDEQGTKFFFDIVEKRSDNFWKNLYFGSFSGSTPKVPASATPIETYADPYSPCVEGSSYGYSQPGAMALAFRSTNVAWFISKIISSNNNEITFTYQDERHSRLSNTVTEYSEKDKKFTNSNNLEEFISKRLTRVDEPNGYLIIDYDINKREDVRDSYGTTSSLYNSSNNFSELKAIKTLKVFNKKDQNVKAIDFVTSYKLSNGIDAASNLNKYLYKRLWLDKIKINNIEEYVFEYNSGNLPYKFSYEQDYWGYFNNNLSDSNNRTMLSDLWFYPGDARSKTRLTNFSIYKRNTYVGSEYRLSTYTRFTEKLSNYLANRDINEDAMRVGMLNKIVYPTKGYEMFTYESNDFLYENQMKKGFGLRVKKIESFDNNNSLLNSVTYKYVDDLNVTSGVITAINVFGKIDVKDSTNGELLYKLSSQDCVSNSNLYYSRVEKVSSLDGKIVSEYFIPYTINTDNSLNNNGSFLYRNNLNISKFKMNCKAFALCTSGGTLNLPKNTFEYPTINLNINYENLFGKKVKEFYFDANNNLLKSVENTYKLSNSSKTQKCFFGVTNNTSVDTNSGSGDHYVKTYCIAELVLSEKKNTDYDNSGNMFITKNENFYNNNDQIIENRYTDSKGDINTTKYDYCDSDLLLFNFACADMRTLNMISYPIIMSKFKNGGLISKTYNKYVETTNNAPFTPITAPILVETFGLDVNKPISDFQEFNWFNPELPNFGSMDSRMKSKIKFHKYETNGNLAEFSKTNDIPTIYIWGYNKTKIIAKIENASYSTISEATITNLQNLSNADNDNCRTSSCKEQLLRNALNNLRDLLPNSMITTYTYDPQIGITSITDLRGQTKYYSYDVMNRLKEIKDADGNLQNEYKYHYKD